MKRIFSLMMVLVMLLSVCAPVFAAEETGSITITNATIGDNYSLYKIFDATYSTDAEGNTDSVSYSIVKENNPVFTYMFGEVDKDGKTTKTNDCFEYDATTGAVTKKDGATKADIVSYLTAMVRSEGNNFAVVDTKKADSQTVKFDNLPYGYYLIDKGNGAAVTIDSNTPDVEVIDKNQIPGNGFEKLVWDEETEKWVPSSSANIGDIVNFEVKFNATNYDGEKQIKYYTIKDIKGEALWVEFNDITVKVGDKTLTRGYYHAVTSDTGKIDHITNEWKYFGTWTEAEKEDPDNAEWYLIHRGFDSFDIVIPWMDNYHFEGTETDFSLTYDYDKTKDPSKSIYGSPVDVVINYSASVEPSANIGGNTNANNYNLKNTAGLSWTSDTTDGPDDPSTTTVTVYALGIEKIDPSLTEGKYLEGAVFELYSDADCTKPVYVIPTNIKGVYILDDLKTIVSGEKRETSREKYAAYLDAYLDGAEQKNVITSAANGKIVVLGLEEGNYYIKETKAPDGYNKATGTTTIAVGTGNRTSFDVYADSNGNVYDTTDAETYVKTTYTVTSAVVENNKGVELPSTGGAGTVKMITIGTIIAMAFAVLLITHKKMSVYHD